MSQAKNAPPFSATIHRMRVIDDADDKLTKIAQIYGFGISSIGSQLINKFS